MFSHSTRRLRISLALLSPLSAVADSPSPAIPLCDNQDLDLAATPQEQRAIRAFDAAKQSPLELNAFLAHAQGWRSPHASLRRRLCRDFHPGRRRRSPLRTVPRP